MEHLKFIIPLLILTVAISLISVQITYAPLAGSVVGSNGVLFTPTDKKFRCMIDPFAPGCEDECPPSCLLLSTDTDRRALVTFLAAHNTTSASSNASSASFETKTVIGTPEAIKSSTLKELESNASVNSTEKDKIEKNIDGLINAMTVLEQTSNVKPLLGIKCGDNDMNVTCTGFISVNW
jgi:hypothetical protein